MQPAIRAWNDYDATVRETDLQVPGEGLFMLGAKVTDLGGGWWTYEYAVQNVNSHRSARAFSIPLDPTGTVSSIGFHDVDYHSGEPFSGVDWTTSIADGRITWATMSARSCSRVTSGLCWAEMTTVSTRTGRPPA